MRTIISFAAISAIAVAALAPAAQSTSTGGNPVNGKKLYEAYICYGCHGFNGETGARVLLPGKTATLATEERFIGFLRGRSNLAPNQPSTSMPNYSAKSLTDEQARDIYAYVRTFKSNAPAVDDIAAFKEILSAAQKSYKP